MPEESTNTETVAESVAETAPTEYSKIPYVIELKDYPADAPEDDTDAAEETEGPKCSGAKDPENP